MKYSQPFTVRLKDEEYIALQKFTVRNGYHTVSDALRDILSSTLKIEKPQIPKRTVSNASLIRGMSRHNKSA